ncbi:MAG: hypothetical protein WCS34_05315 [Bacteroidales bacterium]
MKNNTQDYETPTIRVTLLSVEKGFAASPTPTSNNAGTLEEEDLY